MFNTTDARRHPCDSCEKPRNPWSTNFTHGSRADKIGRLPAFISNAKAGGPIAPDKCEHVECATNSYVFQF